MKDLNFNIYNIIIFTGIIYGLVFSLVLIINKKLKSKTNYFLSFTVLSLAFSNLQYWLIDTDMIPRYKYDENIVIYIPFEFLMLPFFYFFVKNYLQKKTSITEKIFLFFPFTLGILYIFLRNLFSENLQLIKFSNLIVEYVSIVFQVVIIVLMFKIIKKYEKSYSPFNSKKIALTTQWIKRALYAGILLNVLWFISLNVFSDLFSPGYSKYYPLWIGMSILIYWIGHTSILQKNIYNERKIIRPSIIKNTYKEKKNINHKKYNEPLYNSIIKYIKKEKSYLDPNLKTSLISKTFNISDGYLSQLFNNNSGSNFNNLINNLRVEEAKTMLQNTDFDRYTIVAIGLEAGFKSKSNFYTAFKKHTNKTPLEYKKSVLYS